MVLAGCLYTILIVCLNVISSGGGSNLYDPADYQSFSDADIKARIHGSKIVIVSEQAMLNVIYTIKACMLLMYTRLTLNHRTQSLVRYLAIYVLLGWTATEIAFFTACRPFSGYWAMPPPNPQCTTLEHYAIVQACFNISSDTLMLCIPLPLITRLNVPWKQKGVLLLIFGLGAFVVAAAVLTKVFNLSDIWDPSYMLWYTRESSVAVYVSNLPMIWPLMREWIPALRSWAPGRSSSKAKSGNGSGSGGRGVALGALRFGGKRGSASGVVTTIRGKGESMEELSSGDETELVGVERKDNWRDGERDEWEGPLSKGGIMTSTTVEVTEEHVHNSNVGTAIQMPSKSFSNEGDLERGAAGTDSKWDFERGRWSQKFGS